MRTGVFAWGACRRGSFVLVTPDVLRLITCTGAFDAGARSYVDNLVLTAHAL